MLFNEPKLLKFWRTTSASHAQTEVSVLFNEPKLLKCVSRASGAAEPASFSALQRAEIAEINNFVGAYAAEGVGFSALQRAEIAEINLCCRRSSATTSVSVLFNEPKLLKFVLLLRQRSFAARFSALQRAEIAEIPRRRRRKTTPGRFQCSSTSRNC